MRRCRSGAERGRARCHRGGVGGWSDTAIDPRIERTRRVVLEATLDELASVGYGALTVESVARRAGVGKATMYRHWAGKLVDVALLAQLLVGPLFLRRLTTAEPFPVEQVDDLVAMVLDPYWQT